MHSYLIDLTTRKALSFIPENERNLDVLYIQCDTSDYPITLATEINGSVTVTDVHSEPLDKLNEIIQNTTLKEKIKTIETSIEDFAFPAKSFDLIWSDTTINKIDFKKAIREWKSFLKDNAYLVLNSISWLTNSHPKELEDYCKTNHPDIASISEKVNNLENEGYSIAATFALPDGYYPEDSIFEKYKTYFKNVFYIVRKNN